MDAPREHHRDGLRWFRNELTSNGVRRVATFLAAMSFLAVVLSVLGIWNPRLHVPVRIQGPVLFWMIVAAWLFWSILAVAGWVRWFRSGRGRDGG